MSDADDAPTRLRPARGDDVAALVSLAHDVWPTAYAFSPGAARLTIDTWWTPEALRSSLAVTAWLVAERAGHLVGAGNVDLRPEPPRRPVVWILAVSTAEQGRGTGTALLEALAATAAPRGTQLSYLEGNEPAARFYAAHGFVEVGRTPADGPHPAEVVVERA